MTDVADRVKDILAEECAVNRAALADDARLEDVGISSVDMVQVIFAIEEAFGVAIGEEDMNLEAETVGEVALLTGRRRAHTIYAARDSELVRLSPHSFDLMLQRNTRAIHNVSRILGERLAQGLKVDPARARCPRGRHPHPGEGDGADDRGQAGPTVHGVLRFGHHSSRRTSRQIEMVRGCQAAVRP